ncbi:MAG: nucleic acid/nucleotide deaminase domain-containing protein, partial [Rickettsiales bacterium]
SAENVKINNVSFRKTPFSVESDVPIRRGLDEVRESESDYEGEEGGRSGSLTLEEMTKGPKKDVELSPSRIVEASSHSPSSSPEVESESKLADLDRAEAGPDTLPAPSPPPLTRMTRGSMTPLSGRTRMMESPFRSIASSPFKRERGFTSESIGRSFTPIMSDHSARSTPLLEGRSSGFNDTDQKIIISYLLLLGINNDIDLNREFTFENDKLFFLKEGINVALNSPELRERKFDNAEGIIKLGVEKYLSRLGRFSEGRVSKDPDLNSRRLDSIARIITGNTVCAAVAFDGRNILYSNNTKDNTETTRKFFELLKDIALYSQHRKESCSRSRLSLSEDLQERADALFSRVIEESEEVIKSKFSGKSAKRREHLRTQYARLYKDFNKVIDSLTTDDPDKQLHPDIINALARGDAKFIGSEEEYLGREGEGGEYVDGKDEELKSVDGGGDLHAEMAILDHIVEEDRLNITPKMKESGKPFYIGVSKLCCANCHHAIAALNSDLKDREGFRVAEIVETRGEHLTSYGWREPEFFRKRPRVKEIYEGISREAPTLADTVHLADYSASDPDPIISASSTRFPPGTAKPKAVRRGAGRRK